MSERAELSLRCCGPMSAADARLVNPLQLAYIGDTVWELLVRTDLMRQGLKLHHMHVDAIAMVNAAAQATALKRIADTLTDEEADIVRRGRNAHAHHQAPRHQNPADYAAASGLEALMGYLALTGQDERAKSLFYLSKESEEEDHA